MPFVHVLLHLPAYDFLAGRGLWILIALYEQLGVWHTRSPRLSARDRYSGSGRLATTRWGMAEHCVMRLERVCDRLGQPVAVGDEVWDLGCPLERQQNMQKHGTLYVRRLPVVDVFSWGVRLRKANGHEIDAQLFERVAVAEDQK